MLFARQLEDTIWDTYLKGYYDGLFRGSLCGFGAGILAMILNTMATPERVLTNPVATYATQECVGLVKNTTELVWSIAHRQYMI